MSVTDTQIVTFMQRNPHALVCHKPGHGRRYWRILFGPKDSTNRFPSLRSAARAAIAKAEGRA